MRRWASSSSIPGNPGPASSPCSPLCSFRSWCGRASGGSATPRSGHCLSITGGTRSSKVAAGWVWLLAILGAALVWVTLTVLASGGTLGVDEVRLLLHDPVGAAAGTPGAVESVSWTTPWWEWAMPFSAATAAYLLASTLMLATARPLFWAAGLWVGGAVVLGAADIWDIGWIWRATDFVNWYIGGDSFTRGVQLPSGGREAWTLLPTAKMWTASSALWISLGLAGVLWASGRAREH